MTSHDVARAAGVTQSTVSRALSDKPGVRDRVAEPTRRRILEVADALGYVPLETGRSLVTQRTRRIGVVVAELDNPYFTSLVTPLHDVLGQAGYQTLLISDREDDLVGIETLVDGSLDGVMLTTSHRKSSIPGELSRRGIPFVLLGREVDDVTANACVIDNPRGATLAAEFLVGLGHRRIGALFGPRWTSTGDARERAFRRSLSAQGVALRPEHVAIGPFGYSTGYEGLRTLMAAREPPTAVFCANDSIAIGACNAARSLGIDIPRELSVVGFDDISPAAWDVFQLTTIRADLRVLAEQGCALLFRQFEQPQETPQRVVIPVELVLRRTHRRAGT